MGYGKYDRGARMLRATSAGWDKATSFDSISTQTSERRIHDSMNPKDLKNRECRDSDDHPNSIPVMFWLDVTGSMGEIPKMMIKTGLPHLMDALSQDGVKDASLCFGAIGDHEYDQGPLQIGQFEAGDKELDMWLTRTWLERGGGGNAGESYGLAYYAAAYHTITDAWEKRKQKGFLFTCGDEPFLSNYPITAIKEIMGEGVVGQSTFTMESLYKAAQEKFHIFHFHVTHGGRQSVPSNWKELLGQNVIIVDDHNEIPHLMANLIVSNCPSCGKTTPVDHQVGGATTDFQPTEIIL
jgi:hypothetical protein